MDKIQKADILHYDNNTKSKKEDWVADEFQIKLVINDRSSLSLLTYPLNLDELVTGFLYTNGVISSYSDIEKRHFNQDNHEYSVFLLNRNVNPSIQTLTSGCGKGVILQELPKEPTKELKKSDYSVIINAERVALLMKEFLNSSEIFRATGAVHTAAIATTEKLLYFYEDIGRHNAVDKCIGKAILDNSILNNKVLFVTGRISSEIIMKVIMAEIPIIVSRAAPTFRAIQLAATFGITVIGFCRGKKFNIYTHFDRIID